MFPLGASRKADVRQEAAARGLAVADKPDSHDVCFIPDGDTRGFLRGRLGAAPGAIVDADGTVLGRHDGSYGFTVGQRRGLGLDRPAADGRPRYVLDIEPVTRAVTVGPASGLDVTEIEATRPVWSGCEAPADSGTAGPLSCLVQLRAHGTPVPATVTLEQGGGQLRIRLHEPARGVARGQAAVLYDGALVLGSATISAAVSSAATICTGRREASGASA
jgi:tRNA-specific 2-thiouridylase